MFNVRVHKITRFVDIAADEKLVKYVVRFVKIEDKIKLADVAEISIQKFHILMQHF